MQNQQQHQMEVEAEAFNSDKLRDKSIAKGMISEIDHMSDYYQTKIDQYLHEIDKFKSQRNILAKILTD